MKKLLFVIIVVSLFIGCSKKYDEGTQTKKTEVNSQAQIAGVKESKEDKLDEVKDSFIWAKALIESAANKNNVMVDAFELRDARTLYLSPAQIMNGWESWVSLTFRFAFKENAGSTWYDLIVLEKLNWDNTSYSSIGDDLIFSINKVKGKYNLVSSNIGLDEINSEFNRKVWIKE